MLVYSVLPVHLKSLVLDLDANIAESCKKCQITKQPANQRVGLLRKEHR